MTWDARQRSTTIGLIVGGLTGAATAFVTGLDRPLLFGVYAAIVAAVATWLLEPSIARGRPLAGLGLAVIAYGLGVLAFPTASLLLGLESPGTTRPTELRDVLPMYALTPLGLVFAWPFAPAVLVTGHVVGFLSPGTRADPTAPPTDEDSRFERWVGCATIALVVGGVVTFLVISILVSDIGY